MLAMDIIWNMLWYTVLKTYWREKLKAKEQKVTVDWQYIEIYTEGLNKVRKREWWSSLGIIFLQILNGNCGCIKQKWMQYCRSVHTGLVNSKWSEYICSTSVRYHSLSSFLVVFSCLMKNEFWIGGDKQQACYRLKHYHSYIPLYSHASSLDVWKLCVYWNIQKYLWKLLLLLLFNGNSKGL